MASLYPDYVGEDLGLSVAYVSVYLFFSFLFQFLVIPLFPLSFIDMFKPTPIVVLQQHPHR